MSRRRVAGVPPQRGARAEARRDAGNEHLVAWRVGLVGAVAALLGAVLGGAGSYLAAREQTHADLVQSQRASREQAYQGFLTSADAVVSALDALGTGPTSERVDAAYVAVGDLENKANLVALVGAPDVARDARELPRIPRSLLAFRFWEIGPVPGGIRDNPQLQDYAQRVTRITQEMRQDLADL